MKNKRKLNAIKYLGNPNGITLIALVISIIVMLILAGVSINAVVGDNGIIGKAQDSVYLQSIAALQEYLQMKYSEYALEDNPYGTELGLLRAKNPGWFYTNAQGYILDSEGHVLYLIRKTGLPEDIRNQLRGGDASKVSQYYRQEDVYGVTSDLQVYYCKNGTDTIMGLTVDDLQKDNPLEIAYDENTLLAQVANNGEAISTQALKSIKTLTIDTTQKLELLKTFKDLPSLQTVYFSNIAIPNLNDIQFGSNITEVRFTSCAVQDYSALCGLAKLNKLYLITPAGKNTDVATLCSSDKGIATAEFSNLKYFGIVGNGSYIQSTSTSYATNRYDITDISVLANLSQTTKESINYMYLQNLQLTSISALRDYINVTILRCEENALATFDGIQNMSKLTYLISPTCYSNATNTYTLGSNETDAQNTATDALSYIYKDIEGKNINLIYLDIRNAKNLKHISYLKDCLGLKSMWMSGSTSFNSAEVTQIANIYEQCGIFNRSMDSSYRLELNNDTRIDYSNLNLTDTSEYICNLQNNDKVQELNLAENRNLSNSKLQEILKSMPNLKALCLCNCSNLSNIDFVKNVTGLVELDVRGTKVTDLGLLEEYGTSLKTLVIDNKDTILSNIQNTISHLNSQYEKSWLPATQYGLSIRNNEIFKKLEGLDKITYLGIYQAGLDYGAGLNIDLSGCTSLETIGGYHVRCNFKLPSSFKYNGMLYAIGAIWDFSLCDEITSLHFYDCWISSQEQFDAIITSLKSNTSLKYILFQNVNSNTVKNFDALKNLENTNIETFEFASGYSNRITVEDISGLKYLKNLKNFSLYPSKVADISCLSPIYDENNELVSGCPNLNNLTIIKSKIKNLNGIENLYNLKNINLSENEISNIELLSNLTQLTTINLSNNNINNIKPLENLKKLETLNLQNNALYDSSYDSLGKPYYTLTVFSDLNQKQEGNLKNLYLSGNNIEDFSMLQDSNLKWNAKSGW